MYLCTCCTSFQYIIKCYVAGAGEFVNNSSQCLCVWRVQNMFSLEVSTGVYPKLKVIKSCLLGEMARFLSALSPRKGAFSHKNKFWNKQVTALLSARVVSSGNYKVCTRCVYLVYLMWPGISTIRACNIHKPVFSVPIGAYGLVSLVSDSIPQSILQSRPPHQISTFQWCIPGSLIKVRDICGIVGLCMSVRRWIVGSFKFSPASTGFCLNISMQYEGLS